METYDDYQQAIQAAGKLPDSQIIVIPAAEAHSRPSRLHPLILRTSTKVEPFQVQAVMEGSTRDAMSEALQCHALLAYGHPLVAVRYEVPAHFEAGIWLSRSRPRRRRSWRAG